MKRFIRFFLPRRNREDVALIKKVLHDYEIAVIFGDVYDPNCEAHKHMSEGLCWYIIWTYDKFSSSKLYAYGRNKGYETFWAPRGHIAARIPLLEKLLDDLIQNKNLKIL